MSDKTIDYVKKNMEQSELVSTTIIAGVKALFTVLLLLGAVSAFLYLLNSGYALTELGITGLFLCTYFAVYIFKYKSKCITTLKDFLYTESVSWDENFEQVIKSWLYSAGLWICSFASIGFIWIIATMYDTLMVQDIVRLISIIGIASVFFLYTRRNTLKTATGYDYDVIKKCIGFGIAIAIGSYITGGVIVGANTIFGTVITTLTIVLYIVITAVYTILDIKEWVSNTEKQKVRDAAWAAEKAAEQAAKDAAAAQSGIQTPAVQQPPQSP